MKLKKFKFEARLLGAPAVTDFIWAKSAETALETLLMFYPSVAVEECTESVYTFDALDMNGEVFTGKISSDTYEHALEKLSQEYDLVYIRR